MTTYLIGDLHGHHQEYERLLQSAGLCDSNLSWSGGDNHLWLMGDFFDRGESGIRCLDLTMRLQKEASIAGGSVNSLLGNHEMMILCAYTFTQHIEGLPQGHPLYEQWRRWGGVETDFEGFNQSHADWIRTLPAMALVEDALLIHADAMLYVDFGYSIEAVNAGFRTVLDSDDTTRWERCLSAFGEHQGFSALERTGKQRVDQLLALYGGKKIIHGHTPIPWATNVEPARVDHAWTYADGRCVNVDGGIYMGSPGFVYELTES